MVLFPELGIAGRSSLQAEENEFHCGHVGFGSLLTQPHGVVCLGIYSVGLRVLERESEELSAW